MPFSQEQRDLDNRRLAAAKTDRSTHDTIWKDQRNFLHPRAGAWKDETKQGDRNDGNIFNESALYARRTLAQGMLTGISPRSRPWLRYLPPDQEMAEYGPVKEWLYDLENLTRTIFLKSNLYGSLYHMYERMGTFGNGCFGLYGDMSTVITTQRYDIGGYYWLSDASGRLNGFIREYFLTVEQMVAEFGLKNCPAGVQSSYDKGNYSAKHGVVHIICRNVGRNITKKDNKNMPWRSCYYSPEDSSKNLRESGFIEFPIIGGRWELYNNGPYGTGPGHDVLGSVKQLQVQEVVYGEAVEKQVNPPLQAPSSMQDKVVDQLPGGVNFYDEVQGTQGLRSLYDVRLDLNALSSHIGEVERRINRGMFADVFMMLAQMEGVQPRNELELIERKEEKLIALGQVLEGVDNDVLNPVVDLAFGHIMRNGLMRPPPPELHGQELKVEYISILHQAQKAIGVSGIERTTAFAGNLRQVFPEQEIELKYDAQQALDEYADAVGVPVRLIRPDDQVAAMSAERKQAAQQQQMMAMAAQAAESAKTMSETKVGDKGGSALDMLMGQGQ